MVEGDNIEVVDKQKYDDDNNTHVNNDNNNYNYYDDDNNTHVSCTIYYEEQRLDFDIDIMNTYYQRLLS